MESAVIVLFLVWLFFGVMGGRKYTALFEVDISSGGSYAKYAVEWLEDGVQIILSGHKSQYYILPFKTLEDADRLLY